MESQAQSLIECPKCGSSLDPNAILCIDCGYHTKLRKQLHCEVSVNETDSYSEEFAEHGPYSIFVRLFGVVTTLLPLVLMTWHLITFREQDGSSIVLYIVLFISICILCPPGIYLAFKGAGPAQPPGFRVRCLTQIVVGVGFICLWILSVILAYLISFFAGLFILWYGILGVALVFISLGLFSLVSNRDLLQEISDITLFTVEWSD